jgi:hypothetical protein
MENTPFSNRKFKVINRLYTENVGKRDNFLNLLRNAKGIS